MYLQRVLGVFKTTLAIPTEGICMALKKITLKDLKVLTRSPLGAALLLVVLLALIVLTPKEVLPDVLLIVRTVIGYLLIDVGVEII